MQSAEISLSRNVYDTVNISGGTVHLGDQYLHVHHHGLSPGEAARIQFLNSIRFPEMRARLNEIATTKYNTFEWFFSAGLDLNKDSLSQSRNHRKRQQSETFSRWAREGQGIFLIEGKPGSGKSTFMKFLFSHNATSALLREWSTPKPPTLLFHSFWKAGTNLQYNLKGFLASIISQLVTSDARLPEMFQASTLHARHSLVDWSESELLLLLESLLPDMPSYKCLFLDGLDEFDEGDDFDRLYEILEHLSIGVGGFKICASSRPAPHILHYFQGCSSLTLQDLTYDDIYDHVYNTLKERSRRKRKLFASDEILEDVVQTMCRKSEGVFLWVHYVLTNVCRGIISNDNVEDLLRRIESLPSAMEDLYRQMWKTQNKLHSIHSQEAANIFCFGTYFPMPLFQLASCLNTSFSRHSIETLQPLDDEYLVRYLSEFSSQLAARTAGLVEVVSTDESDNHDVKLLADRPWKRMRVQYFHRTVHDFFRDNKSLFATAVAGIDDLNASCDFLWIQSYLSCLVQDVLRLHPETISELFNAPAWFDSSCLPLIDVVDDCCHRLTSSRLHKGIMRDSSTWLFDLRTTCADNIHDVFDYNSMVTRTCSPECLEYLLINRGKNWSPYYKGHLAMVLWWCFALSMTPKPGLHDWLSAWRLLKNSGADFGSVQPFLTIDDFLYRRAPATSVVLRCSAELLQRSRENSTLEGGAGILEALTGLLIDEEHYATLFKSLSGTWSSNQLYASCVVLTYKAKDILAALLEVLEDAQKLPNLASKPLSEHFNTGRIGQNLAKALRLLPCKVHLYLSYYEGAIRGSQFYNCPVWLEKQVFEGVFEGGETFRKLFKSSLFERPTDFMYDIDSRIRWQDVKLWIRPLNPEEDIRADEWKEKGILRDFFAQLADNEPAQLEVPTDTAHLSRRSQARTDEQ